MQVTERKRDRSNAESNKLSIEDRAAHDWYRFVLSFPPHLVRDYLQRFAIGSDQQVLDPFCGTGTTLVECKKLGVPSIGIEANLMAHFASQVKVDWDVDPDGLIEHANRLADAVQAEFEASGAEDCSLPLFSNERKAVHQLRTLPDESHQLLLTNSISPLPLHKTLVLLDCLKQQTDERYQRHELLAFDGKALPACAARPNHA